MKRFLPCMLALACLFSIAATPATAQERPLYADGDGVTISSSSFFVECVSICQATHFGQSLLDFEVRVSDLKNGLLHTQDALMGAANGDAVFMTIDAARDPNTGLYIGTLTITGGVGRFAGARGGADVIILFDDQFSSFRFVLDGTIDF
jgi:hypothetical protein